MMPFIKRSIFPLLLLIVTMAFGIRFADFAKDAGALSMKLRPAVAAESGNNVIESEPLEADDIGDPPSEDDGSLVNPAAQFGENSEKIDLAPNERDGSPEWRDSLDSDFEYSEVRMKLFEDLTARRKDIEMRERELSMREALLTAAEQELDQKYRELQSIKTEIEELLAEQSEEEIQRVASLVKIYEGMKPKDAARIFNTLEMDVLIEVVGKMSERKSAPILASMDPERARELTIRLREQKTLPQASDISDAMLN